jgi:hypothetical protein
MVSILATAANAESLVPSQVRDLRGVPIYRVRGTYARDVDAIVARLVDPAAVSVRPQTAMFSSAI